jgi:Calcineurin-like phosphoesterase
MHHAGTRTWTLRAAVLALCLFLVAAPLFAQTAPSSKAWKFGVMSDTQWTVPDDGQNPNSVSVGIIKQINAQFINSGVKFVIQVGDLTDNGSNIALDTRAQAAQSLYDAGIGFYPFRGNHESSLAGALQFRLDFPQTVGKGDYVLGATHFTSPSANLKGLSYSFRYKNATFVLLDQFTRLDGTGSSSSEVNNTNIAGQLAWIQSTLGGRPAGTHAFVLGHKNLIGQNHVDCLLGSDPSQNPALRNAFISTLAANGVRYYLSGHDHTHQRSLVLSPDSKSSAHQLIGASDSSKFYIPSIPSNDQTYDSPTRETSLAQEVNRIGYYIFTVDGPRMTIDYYSAETDPTYVDGEYLIFSTPTLNFVKQETWTYSLNGKEFLVPQGQDYTAVTDQFNGTVAQILSGTNNSFVTDGSNRPLTKAVNTGWAALAPSTASATLTLSGMADLGTTQTDVYALSLSYLAKKANAKAVLAGQFGIAAKDSNGNWVNAVDLNNAGTKKFVVGPWNSSYGLGTYGVDPNTLTTWAVLDYNADFAAAKFVQ